MNIEIRITQNYGNEAIYIIDQEIAKNIKNLTGCKTLTRFHLQSLKNLGFTFSIQQAVLV